MIRKVLYTIYKSFLIGKSKGGKIYHKGSHKNSFNILLDLLYWFINEKGFNANYLVFGLNIKGSKSSDYIGSKEILKIKYKQDLLLKKNAGCEGFDYDIITKDKLVAESFFKANHIPVVSSIAFIIKGKLLWSDGRKGDLDELFNLEGAFFVKNTILEASGGLLHCSSSKDNNFKVNGKICLFKEFKHLVAQGQWVVQHRLESHSYIQRINDTALNTLRVVTILRDKGPEYLTGFQSFATGSEVTDTWGHGALYVGLNLESYTLMGDAYYHPDYGSETIVTTHPDSNISFEDFKLPFLKEAIELCIKAHNYLPYSYIIGWDVAITAEGPLILEANEKPGMNAVQSLNGGMKRKIVINK